MQQQKLQQAWVTTTGRHYVRHSLGCSWPLILLANHETYCESKGAYGATLTEPNWTDAS